MALTATKALITLGDARLLLGKGATDTADDQLIDMIIGQASVLIAKELGYNPIENSYKEFHAGSGDFLWLENIPVSSVDLISTDRDDVLSVIYDSTEASYATVEVTTTALKLRKRVSGTLTTNTLVLSDYDTIADLDTAIDALTPWTCTPVSSFSTWAASSLIPMPAQHASNSQATFSVPTTPEDDVELTPETGCLYNWRGWSPSSGVRNVYVEYTAGWTRADLPEPLKSACLELVALMYNMSKKDGSLKSEELGDYEYTMADRLGAVFSATGGTSVSNMIAMKLGPYKRFLVRAY